MTLAEFIEQERITMSAQEIPFRLDLPNDKYNRESTHWAIEISRSNTIENVRCYYTQGKLAVKHKKLGGEIYGKHKPALVDVLSSLILDAQHADKNFEDWCDNFSYDSDSRRTQDIYETCKRFRRELIKFLGWDKFRTLMEIGETE